jgi:hypothetical protein
MFTVLLLIAAKNPREKTKFEEIDVERLGSQIHLVSGGFFAGVRGISLG